MSSISTSSNRNQEQLWETSDGRVVDVATRVIVATVHSPSAYDPGDEKKKRNAARIVACVNALAGLNPEAVKDVVCVLRSQANQLDRMAEMLLCKDSPGHANYISKQSAAEWSDGLASELRTFLAALKGGAM